MRGTRRLRRKFPKKIPIHKFNNGDKKLILSPIDSPIDNVAKLTKEDLDKNGESTDPLLQEDDFLDILFQEEDEEFLAREERILQRNLYKSKCICCGVFISDKEDKCSCGYIRDLDHFSRNSFQGSHK